MIMCLKDMMTTIMIEYLICINLSTFFKIYKIAQHNKY